MHHKRRNERADRFAGTVKSAVMLLAFLTGVVVDFRPTAFAADLPPSTAPNTILAPPYEIDLITALRLAERRNPEIAVAREAIAENLALQQQADVLLLPTLAAGSNLRIHRGNLQRPAGDMFEVNLQSLYFGGGVGAVGQGTVAVPAVRIIAPLGDALLEPLLARQRVSISRADARATANTVLLSVATGYIELMGAEARLSAYRRTECEIAKVVDAVNAFVEVGQARKADADRTQSRALFVRNDVLRAEEDVAVASARLARVLDLDPAVRLHTVLYAAEAVQLVDPSCDLDALLKIALAHRPEMTARSEAVAASETRLKQERWRPWLPTVSAGYSIGEFGGGSNFAPTRFGDYSGRTDFDVFAVWTLQNVGVGNLATQRTRRAEVDEAVSQRVRTINQIRDEVSSAFAASEARRRQMEIAERQLATAQSGLDEEVTRTRGGEGLPIEVLNSFELWVKASIESITTVVEYDQSQFRLFVALGYPPPDKRYFAGAPVPQ